jgi:hypothetical protein
VSVQMGVGPQLAGRSFSVEVALGAEAAGTSGVLVALGSRFAGWSLYLDKGRPVFTYVASTHSDDIVSTTASRPIVGKNLTLKFLTAGPRKQAAVSVSDAEGILASGIIKNTFLIPAGLGETLDIGRDTGVPVVAYTQPLGAFPDEILHVRITLAGPEQHGGH